jgi:site-specific recombinase XerD
VKIERAIDAFLDWRRIERDATPRSIDSYWRILSKLAADYPEVLVHELSTEDRRRFLNRWRAKSAATRSNVISVLDSFFAWAESEDLVNHDPSRKMHEVSADGTQQSAVRRSRGFGLVAGFVASLGCAMGVP